MERICEAIHCNFRPRKRNFSSAVQWWCRPPHSSHCVLNWFHPRQIFCQFHEQKHRGVNSLLTVIFKWIGFAWKRRGFYHHFFPQDSYLSVNKISSHHILMKIYKNVKNNQNKNLIKVLKSMSKTKYVWQEISPFQIAGLILSSSWISIQ